MPPKHRNTLQNPAENDEHDRHEMSAAMARCARNGDVCLIETLLNEGAEIDAKNKWNQTALRIALEHGQAEAMEVLIKRGAAVNALEYGIPLLHCAVNRNSIDMAELLLKNGAEVDAEWDDHTALLAAAFELHNVPLLELLIQHGANVNTMGSFGRAGYGRTPLHCATYFDQPEAVEFLLHHGADIDARDTRGQTPLHAVCMKGNKRIALRIATLLVKNGADVNARDEELMTPLHCAGTCASIAELLLHHGAELEARSLNGRTPLYVTCGDQNASAAVVDLLIQHGANVNIRVEQLTPLYISVYRMHINIVRLLVEGGAEVNVYQQKLEGLNNGGTPLGGPGAHILQMSLQAPIGVDVPRMTADLIHICLTPAAVHL